MVGYAYAVPFRKRPAYRYTVKHSIYVHHEHVSRGVGRRLLPALIDACAEECRRQGVSALEWYTALENTRAQSVYDRTGASRETLIEYELELTS